MRFARVVETSILVGSTTARNAKVGLLSELLREASASEIGVVTAWLAGEVPQGKLGVGWRSLSELAVAARPAEEDQLDPSVTEVNGVLEALAHTQGPGSVAARKSLLGTLMARLDTREQRFVVGLLTGELRQGAMSGVMSAAIASASGQPSALIRRVHMLTGSLPETAVVALGDDARSALESVGLAVGRPIAPMLATPAAGLDAAWDALGPDLVIDHKLDGARIQVHRDGADVAVFTRTLHDVTARVPDLVAVVRGLPARSVILDGETLTLYDDGRPRPFQETMSRFGTLEVAAGGAGADAPRVLRPFFFDCLHLDGADLIDRPLADRLDALATVAPALRVPSFRPPDPAAAHGVLDAALAAGHEGVMVKSLAGSYAAGRRGKAWQKVKPVHTLDLVVLAAEWGSGRRTGLLSNLHLGARDPDGGLPIMVGKTFKGLTDELLRWQTAEFERFAEHRDNYTVYLRPQIVVEIALDGAQQSSRYPGGVALRFARVVRYRPDKSAAQADTIDAVRDLLVRGGDPE